MANIPPVQVMVNHKGHCLNWYTLTFAGAPNYHNTDHRTWKTERLTSQPKIMQYYTAEPKKCNTDQWTQTEMMSSHTSRKVLSSRSRGAWEASFRTEKITFYHVPDCSWQLLTAYTIWRFAYRWGLQWDSHLEQADLKKIASHDLILPTAFILPIPPGSRDVIFWTSDDGPGPDEVPEALINIVRN